MAEASQISPEPILVAQLAQVSERLQLWDSNCPSHSCSGVQEGPWSECWIQNLQTWTLLAAHLKTITTIINTITFTSQLLQKNSQDSLCPSFVQGFRRSVPDETYFLSEVEKTVTRAFTDKKALRRWNAATVKTRVHDPSLEIRSKTKKFITEGRWSNNHKLKLINHSQTLWSLSDNRTTMVEYFSFQIQVTVITF